jgi:hypothetical protein
VVGSTVHVHVADQKAITRWIDEIPSEEGSTVASARAAR